jgi:hypothetical protein
MQMMTKQLRKTCPHFKSHNAAQLMLLLICGLVPQLSFGDVLFINLNNSKFEVRATRDVAAKNDEAFFEFKPDENEEDTLRQLEDFYEVNNLADSKIDTLVFSGHSSGNEFFGSKQRDGIMDSNDIRKFASRHPEITENLKYLILPGCYTLSTGVLVKFWLNVFPNTRFFAGYSEIGASNTNSLGIQFVRSVMTYRNEFSKKTGLKLLPSAVVQQLPVAIYVDDTYFSKQGSMSFAEMMRLCETPFPQDLYRTYLCYLKAEPQCPDVPEDVHVSKLRQYYSYVQSHGHCAKDSRDQRFPAPLDIVQLIFSKNIRMNFLRNYPQVFRDIDSAITQLGWSDSLKFNNVQSLSRKILLDRIAIVNSRVAKILVDEGDHIDFHFSNRIPVVMSLKSLLVSAYDHVANFNSAPLNWIEPKSDVKSSDPPESKANIESEFDEYMRWVSYARIGYGSYVHKALSPVLTERGFREASIRFANILSQSLPQVENNEAKDFLLKRIHGLRADLDVRPWAEGYLFAVLALQVIPNDSILLAKRVNTVE